jgi:hypothetical protein
LRNINSKKKSNKIVFGKTMAEHEEQQQQQEQQMEVVEEGGGGKFIGLPMPLELHCEWFDCLPLFEQRRLIWQLCRGIYAVKGRKLKCNLEVRDC